MVRKDNWYLGKFMSRVTRFNDRIEPYGIEYVKKYLPEYREILARSGGHKPKKFVEAIEIITTPARFDPSAIGDYAYLKSFVYDIKTGQIGEGPAYSYDTMMWTRGVTPHERVVNAPQGTRVWITVYDGMWGGYWHTVHVYINPADIPATKLITGETYHDLTSEEWAVLALTAGYVSGYRREKAREYSINYDAVRESLIVKGYLTKAGALSGKGKSALKSKYPHKVTDDILKELGFKSRYWG